MRPTYLCIPDLTDTHNRPVDIEAEQEQAIYDKVGIWPTVWIWRERMEHKLKHAVLWFATLLIGVALGYAWRMGQGG